MSTNDPSIAKSAPPPASPPRQGLFDIIGGIFKPILSIIIAAGMIQVARDILVMTGAFSENSSSYIFMNSMADAVFYFLPIWLAFSSARIFGASPYLAAAVAAFLIHPDVTRLFEWVQSTGWDLTIFNVIPVTYARYPASVVPIILIVWVQSYLEKGIKRIVPDLLKTILVPLLTFFLSAFIGLVVLGPAGTWLGNLLALVINAMNSRVPWLVPAVVGALSPFMVLTGTHYALFPVVIQNLATMGYDTVMLPGMAASNLALAGMSFAIGLRSRGKIYKSYSISAGLTSIFGISQSSLYGNAIPLKRPLYAAIIAGGAGGLLAGLTGAKGYSFVNPGAMLLISAYKPEDPANIAKLALVIALSLVLSFALTLAAGFEEPDDQYARELAGATAQEKAALATKAASAAKAAADQAVTASTEASLEAEREQTHGGAASLAEATRLAPRVDLSQETDLSQQNEDDETEDGL